MAGSIPAARKHLIDAIAAQARTPRGGSPVPLEQFVKDYYRGVDEDDLRERTAGALAAAARDHLRFGAKRRAGRHWCACSTRRSCITAGRRRTPSSRSSPTTCPSSSTRSPRSSAGWGWGSTSSCTPSSRSPVMTRAGCCGPTRPTSAEPYPADLLRTDRFTAFAGLYEDTTTFTDPGHGWDQLLLEYLYGRRAAPAWAVGESAFHCEGQAGKRLGDVQTVVLATGRDPAGIMEALRSGRVYCRLRTDDENLSIGRFKVLSPQAEPAEAGGRLTLRPGDRPEVHAVIESVTGRRLAVDVGLIRSGSVIQTLRAETPVTVRWTEPPLASNARQYYRLEARGPAGLRLLSNPIFVQASQERTQ